MFWAKYGRQLRSWEYYNPELCQQSNDAVCLRQLDHADLVGKYYVGVSIEKLTISFKIKLQTEEIMSFEGTPVVISVLKLSSKGSSYHMKYDILLRPYCIRGQIQDIGSAEGPLG